MYSERYDFTPMGRTMNPYARFRLVSNTLSAALIVGGLAVLGQPIFDTISQQTGGAGTKMYASLAGAVTVLVVFWLAMTEAIFPAFFRFNAIRKLILGKFYIEGTWLQAERGAKAGHRLAVIDIQPSGRDFIFSGYALNEDLEVESNTLIELSRFEWPFMTYKYRNSLSDGGDGQREGVGEIQFEMNRSAAQRYNGFAQYVKNPTRLKIEGAKLMRNSEVKRLRSLEGRQAVLSKYWELFFNNSIQPVKKSGPASIDWQAPKAVVSEKSTESSERSERSDRTERAPRGERTERRAERAERKDRDDAVVPRRRTSDWKREAADADAPETSESDKIEIKSKNGTSS
ncbi:MAG: hypothetical protein ACRBEQ_13485 [Hyphomonas sp.]